MGYSIKNLRHLMENAILADQQGIDLWDYEPEPGRSILQALKYLSPYFTEGKAFPYQQIGGIEGYWEAFLELLCLAAPHYSDPYLQSTINAFPHPLPDYSRIHLTFPIFTSISEPGPK
jgi:hypothetical protein